ncbi:MAG: prepilin-type N-terminal cleavage/methylation domain-containing protein [Kiritimatiellia bacterium]
MRKRGFSLVEALAALAILALISIGLLPLMIGLVSADQRNRVQAEAWRSAQNELTALYVNDPKLSPEVGAKSPFIAALDFTTAPAGKTFRRLSVTRHNETKPDAVVYLESSGASGRTP